MALQHIIRKQVIELSVDRSLDAQAIQQDFIRAYWDTIVPALEKTLDACSNEREYILLDRVELYLGEVNAASLERSGLKEELILRLVSLLKDRINTAMSRPEISAARSPVLHKVAQWLYYMEHGHLPWNLLSSAGLNITDLLEGLAADYSSIEALRQLIDTNPKALQRIVNTYAPDFLQHLLEVLIAKKGSGIRALLEDLSLIYREIQGNEDNTVPVKQQFNKAIWELTLALASIKGPAFELHQVAMVLLPSWIADKPAAEKIETRLAGKLRMIRNIPALVQEGATGNRPAAIAAYIASIKEKTQKDPERKEREEELLPAGTIIEEGIFVPHAGLVILNPFLTLFFRQLHYLEEGRFIDDTFQQRALFLLHYLATGQQQAEEHELVIAKVLAGYPVEEPLTLSYKCGKKERAMADELLLAVIEKWTVLKNTSIAGLREGFIARNGKLSRHNDRLVLQVEPQSIDLLLDRLPWPVSIIKLPWMKEILAVEWR